MTEKRFNDAKGYVYDGKKCIGIINDDYTCENIINLLNTFNDENEQLKEDNRLLIDDSEKYRKLSVQFDNRNKELISENEQLKQRNDRQAKQLDRLYHLIEKKDWRALNDILDDFKRCEEQLQKEWGAYGDLE